MCGSRGLGKVVVAGKDKSKQVTKRRCGTLHRGCAPTCLPHVISRYLPGRPSSDLPLTMDLPVIDLDLFLTGPRDSEAVIRECKKV